MVIEVIGGHFLLHRGTSDLLDLFVPEILRRQGADRVRQARLSVVFAAVFVLASLIGAVSHALRGAHVIAAAFVAAAVLSAGSVLLLRRLGSVSVTGTLLTLAWFGAGNAAALARGGLGAPSLLPSLVAPLLATLLVGARAGVRWALFCCVWIGVLFVARAAGVDLIDDVPAASRPIIHAIMGGVFTLAMLGIGLAYERLRTAAMDDLERQTEEVIRAERDAQMMFADRMSAIGRLAAGTAHEINNPLTYLLANLDLIGEAMRENPRHFDGDLRAAVDEARDGASRIAAIVGDLKTFARAEEEGLSAVDCRSVLESTVRMVANEARHRARLIERYGEVPAVLANDSRLAQVCLNVLLNAVQAIPVGRADEDQITVSTSMSGERVQIEIADTGVGIPTELLDRVMDPFFTTKPSGAGTGLGLSVSRNIVQRLGGEINIASTLGKGTVVTILLDATNEAPPPSPPRLPRPQIAADEHARILVIDDDLRVAKTLARMLRPHRVEIATGGRRALEILADDPNFDLVVCDLMMPDVTGMQIYEALERTAPDLAPSMLFVSGGTFSPAARAFAERMGDRVVEKPFDEHRVRETVERRLETSRQRALQVSQNDPMASA